MLRHKQLHETCNLVKLDGRKMTIMRKTTNAFTAALVVLFLIGNAALVYGQQKDKTEINCLSRKPVLGWSSWSFVRTHPTAAKIEKEALALKKSGLEEIGYKYVNLDDHWYVPSKQGPNVGPYGRWVTDSTIFPAREGINGIEVVAEYVHSLGLKFGIYVTPGISMQAVRENTPIKGTPYTADQIAEPSVRENNYNCGGMVGINFSQPGAQAFINSWVDMFAKWGVDFIKLDGITNKNTADIKAWSRAIRQSGRPMILDITQGSYTRSIALTLVKYANQWEFAPDIEAYSLEKDGNSYPLTSWANVKKRFDYAAEWQPFAGPTGYNDYDAIEVGNGKNDGLTPDERMTQLSLWAIASSPLILGVDLTHLNPQDLQEYLKNTAVLAVDQDGIAAKRLVNTRSRQVFAKMEPNGDVIAGLFNIGAKAEKISIQVSTLGLPENSKGYSLDNLWTGRTNKTDGTTVSATVPPHGVVLYRVQGLQ